MGTEFRKGPPPREHVEAALKQGLLWQAEGDDIPYKLAVSASGDIVGDHGRPFARLENMAPLRLSDRAWRLIRLGDGNGMENGRGVKTSEAVLIDWAALDALSATPAASPPLAVGDLVSLRAWEGCERGLNFTSDSDRPRLAGQTATITCVNGDCLLIMRDGIPQTAWLRSHVDLVSPAAPKAVQHAVAAATVPYRDFPTTEQIRAHEANGGVWQLESGFSSFVVLWYDADKLLGWHIDSAADGRGPGWGPTTQHRNRKHRPVLTDGTPVAWETLGAAAPVAAAAAASTPREFQVGDTVRLGRHAEIEGRRNWNDEMELYVGQLAKITSIDPCSIYDQGQLVRVDSNRWQWRCSNMELVCAAGSSTAPPPTTAPDTRLFTEIPVALLSAHKGEWEEPSAGRVWKFEVRPDGVWVDWRGKGGGMPFSIVLEPPGSSRWDTARKTKLRPIDSAGLPIPWVAITVQATQPFTRTLSIQEITMPTPAAPATTTSDTFVDRVKSAFVEGAKRAPVEVAVDMGHDMLKELLISLNGPASPREEGIIREYVTKLLNSDYGKALGSFGFSEVLQFAASHLGKRGGLAKAAGREFANRAATVAEKKLGGDIAVLIPKGIKFLDQILDAFAGEDCADAAELTLSRNADVQSLSPGRGVGASATEQLGLDVAVPAR